VSRTLRAAGLIGAILVTVAALGGPVAPREGKTATLV